MAGGCAGIVPRAYLHQFWPRGQILDLYFKYIYIVYIVYKFSKIVGHVY
jgi:hypothetical protein